MLALWHPSNGLTRKSALIRRLIMPLPSERNVHGNVSFEPAFFERALAADASEGAGLALLHSHPLGRGWQRVSGVDIEEGRVNESTARGATRLPFVGLTI